MMQDQNITTVSEMLQPYMIDNFGFEIYSRTSLMLTVPSCRVRTRV